MSERREYRVVWRFKGRDQPLHYSPVHPDHAWRYLHGTAADELVAEARLESRPVGSWEPVEPTEESR